MRLEEREAKKAYEMTAKIYENHRQSGDGVFYNRLIEMPAMMKMLGNVKGKKILDWGCGSGIYAKELAKKGAIVKGFDISPEMIKIAKEKNPNLDLRVGSGLNIPFKEKFDIVFASLALHYLKDTDKALKEVKRVLNSSGVFIFSIDNPITKMSTGIILKGRKYRLLGERDYFKEGPIYSKLSLMKRLIAFPSYHKTFGVIIKEIINNDFDLVEYVDPKPLKSAKQKFPKEYEYYSKVPIFSIWKIRRK